MTAFALSRALALSSSSHHHLPCFSLLRLGLFFVLFWGPGLLEASQFHVHHWFY